VKKKERRMKNEEWQLKYGRWEMGNEEESMKD
jgi:hypothetical protein